MPVAKSYQKYSTIGEPYSDKNRMYIKIDYKGEEKVVRWYSDKEYLKMYPKETVSVAVPANSEYYRPQKDVLGFEKGYITIFTGINENNENWFRESPARYTRMWGWFFPSSKEVPEILPVGVTPIELRWEDITSSDQTTLLSEEKIKSVVDALIYPPTESEFVGTVGERLDFILKVNKVIQVDSSYGISSMHIMSDYDGNTFIWNTNSKSLSEDKEYEIKGTIKGHNIYKGDKQTILTRCFTKELNQ